MKWFLRERRLQFNCTFLILLEAKVPWTLVWECAWEDYITRSGAVAETRLFGTIERCLSHLSSSEQDHGEKRWCYADMRWALPEFHRAPHNRVVPFVYNSFKKQKDCRSGCIAGHPFDAPAVENHAENSTPRSNELDTEKCMRVSQQLCAQWNGINNKFRAALGNKWFWGAQVAARWCYNRSRKREKRVFRRIPPALVPHRACICLLFAYFTAAQEINFKICRRDGCFIKMCSS